MKPKPGGMIDGIINRHNSRMLTCEDCEGYYIDTEQNLHACMIHDKLIIPEYAPYYACKDFKEQRKGEKA